MSTQQPPAPASSFYRPLSGYDRSLDAEPVIGRSFTMAGLPAQVPPGTTPRGPAPIGGKPLVRAVLQEDHPRGPEVKPYG